MIINIELTWKYGSFLRRIQFFTFYAFTPKVKVWVRGYVSTMLRLTIRNQMDPLTPYFSSQPYNIWHCRLNLSSSTFNSSHPYQICQSVLMKSLAPGLEFMHGGKNGEGTNAYKQLFYHRKQICKFMPLM